MKNKKIIVNNCKNCPFVEYHNVQLVAGVCGTYVYFSCEHPNAKGMLITDEVETEEFSPNCPLSDESKL